MSGPQPFERAQRLQRVGRIAEKLQEYFGPRLLALGLYGSTGRNQDEPYSDIEMLCIISGADIDTSVEWSEESWKAEVNIYSPERFLEEAARVEGDWPITQAAFVHNQAIFDPQNIFEQARRLVLGQPEASLRQAQQETIVGEIYELVGKIRNARVTGKRTMLAGYVIDLVKFGACLIALSHRRLFHSSTTMLEEARALPDRPDGFDHLCELAMAGKLDNEEDLYTAVEDFWEGVERWAKTHRLVIVQSLEGVLAQVMFE